VEAAEYLMEYYKKVILRWRIVDLVCENS